MSYIGQAINEYSRFNGKLHIIAWATDSGSILISIKDLKIDNLQELSGKKVVVPQFVNTKDLSLRHILQENGFKDSTKEGTAEILQAEIR